MPHPICKIGGTEFRFWRAGDAPPNAPTEKLIADVRPGVNGVEFTKLGKSGEPFQLVSQCDYETFEAADDAYRGHLTLITQLLTLIWNDLDSNDSDYKVQVMDMKKIVCKALASAVGGLNPPSNAWQECIWTLFPVDTSA